MSDLNALFQRLSGQSESDIDLEFIKIARSNVDRLVTERGLANVPVDAWALADIINRNFKPKEDLKAHTLPIYSVIGNKRGPSPSLPSRGAIQRARHYTDSSRSSSSSSSAVPDHHTPKIPDRSQSLGLDSSLAVPPRSSARPGPRGAVIHPLQESLHKREASSPPRIPLPEIPSDDLVSSSPHLNRSKSLGPEESSGSKSARSNTQKMNKKRGRPITLHKYRELTAPELKVPDVEKPLPSIPGLAPMPILTYTEYLTEEKERQLGSTK